MSRGAIFPRTKSAGAARVHAHWKLAVETVSVCEIPDTWLPLLRGSDQVDRFNLDNRGRRSVVSAVSYHVFISASLAVERACPLTGTR